MTRIFQAFTMNTLHIGKRTHLLFIRIKDIVNAEKLKPNNLNVKKIIQLGTAITFCSTALAAEFHVSAAAAKAQPGHTNTVQEGVKNLTYKKVDDVELVMKITYPPDWKADGKKLPAIVLFFGGGWHAGDITQFRITAPFLAGRGMIVVTPEYRTIQKHGVTPVQCLADAKSAMRYVYINAAALGIDASRIAAGGISAGGHLAAATAFSKGFDDPADDLQVNCKPSALALIVPVIDNGPGGFAHDQVKAYWEAFSPMHNIGPNPPPALFLVGDLDKYIPVATAHQFKAEMEKHGGRCDLKIYEKADHAFNFSPTGSKATHQDMDDFFVSLGYLKTKETP
jgi:acetyl esterase/lipase